MKTKCHVTQGADQKLSAVASPDREKTGRGQQYKKTSGHLTIDCNYFQLVYLWRRAYFAPCSPIGLENYLKISTQFAFMSQPLKKYWSSLTFCPKYSHLNEILKTLLLNFICQCTSSILKLWENQYFLPDNANRLLFKCCEKTSSCVKRHLNVSLIPSVRSEWPLIQ